MAYDLELIYHYMYLKESRYEADMIQLSDNVSFRKADALDHVEMIMAQTRAATANEIFNDLHVLLKMLRSESTKK